MTQPEEVYGYRKNPNTKDWEVLISWKGLPPHEATWEDYNDFKHQFPDFHLEDKVDLEEESSVKPPLLFTYNRRNKEKLAHEMLVRDVEGNMERGNYSESPHWCSISGLLSEDDSFFAWPPHLLRSVGVQSLWRLGTHEDLPTSTPDLLCGQCSYHGSMAAVKDQTTASHGLTELMVIRNQRAEAAHKGAVDKEGFAVGQVMTRGRR
ncbi:ty3-gypsy retroelement transposase [Cucumis melo var. makuwa]|uniref:Ty3-gypsy retroelement transposase n=1 Tax=Cucumis melo var. makuwa TaxID=1194695 RepID=A0A5D3DJN4_CUCMM|nr:ty3-gypsy retroelement transposase [Cucumis melo var. makuwa]